MSNRLLKAGLVFSTLVPTFLAAGVAKAAESATVFWVDHDILTWSQTKSKPDTGSSSKSSNLVTTPNNATIGIFWSDYGVYVTPGVAGGTVGLSYYPQKDLEVGVLLGTANSKNENLAAGTQTVDSKRNSYGLFGTYYLPVHATGTLEFSLSYLHSDGKDTTETTTGATTTTVTTLDSKTNGFTILAQYALQIAPHFNYVPGIAIASNTTKDSTTDNKNKSNGLTLNIVHFRYVF